MFKKFLVVLLLIVSLSACKAERIEVYLASTTAEVLVRNKDGSQAILPRGVLVKAEKKDAEEIKIEYEGNTFLAKTEQLVNEQKDAVIEHEAYINAGTIAYKEDDPCFPTVFLPRGTAVQVSSYLNMQDNGEVDKYLTDYGYIRSEYLSLQPQAEVSSDYGTIHEERGNVYGSGAASQLDYSLRNKPVFADNIMPEEIRALYINEEAVVNMEEYVDIAQETGINAFVINIKDGHMVAYKSDVAQTVSPSTYQAGILSKEEYAYYLGLAKEAGIYLIGRITVFKDSNYGNDHPEDAIIDLSQNAPFIYGSSIWPSVFDRDVWKYNLDICKEAVQSFGFNEIQFDYIRFPEGTAYYADRLGLLDLRNAYNETRSQAVQNFLIYATDELHDLNVYVSADVFGETANPYVTTYGQYLPAISQVVDVISPMPYPDHFNAFEYGLQEVSWTVPYELLTKWGQYLNQRQQEIANPAKVRCYIQGYDSIRYPVTVYDCDKLLEQINALKDSDIYDGYIVWNGASNLDRYNYYRPVFNQ